MVKILISPKIGPTETTTDILIRSGGNTMGIQVDKFQGVLSHKHKEIINKVDKVTGKGLSANDYTNAEKYKLSTDVTPDQMPVIIRGVLIGSFNPNLLSHLEVGSGYIIGTDGAFDNIHSYTYVAGTIIYISGLGEWSVLGLTHSQYLDLYTISNKVDKVSGKGLSSLDFGAGEKAALTELSSHNSGTNTGDNSANTLYSGLDAAKRDKLTTFNNQTGTSYTLVLTDNGKHLTFANASGIDVQIPLNSSVAFPVGTQIDCSQILAGKVTFGAGAGVTINSKGGLKAIGGQWVGVTLLKTATDVWSLFGDLIA